MFLYGIGELSHPHIIGSDKFCALFVEYRLDSLDLGVDLLFRQCRFDDKQCFVMINHSYPFGLIAHRFDHWGVILQIYEQEFLEKI